MWTSLNSMKNKYIFQSENSNPKRSHTSCTFRITARPAARASVCGAGCFQWPESWTFRQGTKRPSWSSTRQSRRSTGTTYGRTGDCMSWKHCRTRKRPQSTWSWPERCLATATSYSRTVSVIAERMAALFRRLARKVFGCTRVARTERWNLKRWNWSGTRSSGGKATRRRWRSAFVIHGTRNLWDGWKCWPHM